MKASIFVFIVLLSGCVSQSQIQLAKIPIVIKAPAPVIPSEPELAIYKLNKASSAPDVLKAYVSSIVALRGWGKSMVILLESYKN